MLAAVLLLALPDLGKSPADPQRQTSGKALIGGPFSLTAPDGKRVTEKDFLGRAMLVYFGFTNCPDICPSGLQIISAALDKLGPKADGLAPIFITVDPERDTPAVMGQYVKSFSPHIIGLSGTEEEVKQVAKAYRVYFRKTAPDPANGSYSVDHSSFMYLMNSKGEFVKHLPHTIGVDELAQELTKVQ